MIMGINSTHKDNEVKQGGDGVMVVLMPPVDLGNK